MIKRSVLVIIVSAFLFANAKAQDSRAESRNGALALELGASVNYYYGQPGQNIDKFENDRVNWQLNGMLGITLGRDRSDRRTMIAAFGAFGFNNDNTIANLLSDQQYTSAATSQANVNNFYQVEGGIMILDMIRLSTGVGQQNFKGQSLVSSNGILTNATYLKYNSSTVGVKLNLGPVAWTLNCNFAYGQDYNKTVIAPNTGLMLRF
jgi:hypothetical protein